MLDCREPAHSDTCASATNESYFEPNGMKTEKTPEEQLLDLVRNETARIAGAGRGRGATVDDPCLLGAMHSLLAPMTEKMLVSIVYGKENRDWLDDGRRYHKNGTICEQRVRLGPEVNSKLDWARPGQSYSMFFDISELTHQAPIPEEVRQLLMRAAPQVPVPDATLVSRFPLIEVRAKNAVEATRIICGHLRSAEAQGWKVGGAIALVDNWRNDYELTRGNEKTIMQFDMRPCVLSDSPGNLIVLTMLATKPDVERALQEFERSKSLTQACAVTGTEIKQFDLPTKTARTGSQPPPVSVAGPPGGVVRYQRTRQTFDLRQRINMLNGFYSETEARVLPAVAEDYRKVAIREKVDVAPDTMAFLLHANRHLYLNVGQRSAVTNVSFAYVWTPNVTTFLGPTFADALCYGFYRLVCSFVGKVENLTEEDILQHARDLKQWESHAPRIMRDGKPRPFALQDVKTTLRYILEFGAGTPLESLVATTLKKLRWRFIT